MPTVSNDKRVEELLAATHLFGEAWANHDYETLDSLLAEDYVHTDIEGRVFDRQHWLSDAQEQPRGYSISFRDVEATVHGDVGVVTGANRLAGGGSPIGAIRFTQVWIWRSGRWQRRAFQATRVSA